MKILYGVFVVRVDRFDFACDEEKKRRWRGDVGGIYASRCTLFLIVQTTGSKSCGKTNSQ